MSEPQRNSKNTPDANPAPGASPAVPALPRRQALLVPGMHRSGTSALTGVLSHLGARPPRTLLPNAKDNPRGFWESAEVVRFNDQVLASGGSRWDDWEPFNRDWMASAVAESFLARVPELLEKEYGDAPLLLLKDPRICRLMPFWTQAFARQDIDVRVVIPLRHPGEVAGSLEARNKFGRHRVLLIWLRHVLEAELATRALPRTLLHFEDLLDDWRGQCQRISDELDIKWPRWSGTVEMEIDQYLSSELRHQRAQRDQVTSNPELQGWVDTARRALQTLVDTQGRDPAARAALDGLREDFDRRSSIFASVVSEYAQASTLALKDLEDLRKSTDDERTALEGLRAEAELKAARVAELEAVSALARQQLTDAQAAVDNASAQLGLQDRVIADMRALLLDRDQDAERLQARSAIRIEEMTRQLEEATANIEELTRQLEEVATSAKAENDQLAEQATHWEAQALVAREEATSLRATVAKQKAQAEAWVARIDATALQVAEANKELVLKNREIERGLGERFKEIERLTRLLIKAESLHAERDSQIAQLRSRLQTMEASPSWRMTAPVRRLARAAKRLRHRNGGDSDAALVRASGWFDTAWYLQRYPDVAAAGIEPVAHYLEFGAFEGRDPGPRFDTRYYLQTYPDVVASGVNPLVHFLRHGQSEQRKARLSNT